MTLMDLPMLLAGGVGMCHRFWAFGFGNLVLGELECVTLSHFGFLVLGKLECVTGFGFLVFGICFWRVGMCHRFLVTR